MKASYYHDLTSYDRARMSGHALDWANQPEVFKRYPDARKLALPRVFDTGRLQGNFFDLCAEGEVPAGERGISSAQQISELLLLTQAITAGSTGGGKDYYFRSAASAGALYPTEIYLASRGVDGIDDGVFHYCPALRQLSLIRAGDFLTPPGRPGPCIVMFFTAVFFRSSWKYRDRAYRYHLLDTGHVIENAVLALKYLKMPHRLSYDFDDRAMNLLLGIDDSREVTLAVLEIPPTGFASAYAARDLPPLPSSYREASRTAEREKHYDSISEIHGAGNLIRPMGKGVSIIEHLGLKAGQPARAFGSNTARGDNYPEVLFKRRSKRNFKDSPIEGDGLASLVSLMLHEQALLGVGLLLGSSGELDPGFYLIDEKAKSLLMVRQGRMIENMADICLHQLWLSRASAHFVFLSAPSTLDAFYGPRGYRYAMMEAGRLGQRLYMGATALGLGCCAIGAFYDREAAALLGLADDARMLYLLAVGHTLK